MRILTSTYRVLLLFLEIFTCLTTGQKVAKCDKPTVKNATISCTTRPRAGRYLDGTSCTIFCDDGYMLTSGPSEIDCYRGQWLYGGNDHVPYSTPTVCGRIPAVRSRSSSDQILSAPSHDGQCSNTKCENWYHGIPRKICENRGCCWDKKKKQCNTYLEYKCQIAYDKRSKCPGTWRGIPKRMCQTRGCCYDGDQNTCYSAKDTEEVSSTTKPTEAFPRSGSVSPCTPFEQSLQNGRLDCTKSNGELQCRARCDKYHVLEGTETRSCHLNTGELSPGSWNCRREYCKEISNLWRTFVDCTNGNRIGSVCTATCARGFQLFEDRGDKATCLAQGEWSEPTAWQCRETLCPALELNERVTEGAESYDGRKATLDCTNGRKFGSVCTVSCPLGYYSLGAAIRCNVNGAWSAGTFKCIPLSCSTPFVTDDVIYTCRNGYNVGSICDFRCPRGYKIRGAKSMTCRANQRWSSDPGQTECNLFQECEAPYVPGGAEIQLCTDGFEVGSLCSIKCPEGKSLLGSNVNTVACMESLHWHRSFEGESCEGPPECKDLKIVYPDVDWNKLTVVCSGGSKVGSVCDISCGSNGVESAVTVCTHNEKGELEWNISPPSECIDLTTKNCDIDIDLSSGQVSAAAESNDFVTVEVSPVLPVWRRWIRGGVNGCQYQSMVKINYKDLSAVALRLRYDVPSSVHFEIKSTKASAKDNKFLTGKNFQLQRSMGSPLRGFFQSKSDVTLILSKKSSTVTYTKGATGDKDIEMDFSSDNTLYVGLNRAVNLLSDYDIGRMGKGMCKFCVAYSKQQ